MIKLVDLTLISIETSWTTKILHRHIRPSSQSDDSSLSHDRSSGYEVIVKSFDSYNVLPFNTQTHKKHWSLLALMTNNIDKGQSSMASSPPPSADVSEVHGVHLVSSPTIANKQNNWSLHECSWTHQSTCRIWLRPRPAWPLPHHSRDPAPLQPIYQTSQRFPVFMGVPSGQLKWRLKSGELASVPMTRYLGGLCESVTRPSWALSGVLTEHHTWKAQKMLIQPALNLGPFLSFLLQHDITNIILSKERGHLLIIFKVNHLNFCFGAVKTTDLKPPTSFNISFWCKILT